MYIHDENGLAISQLKVNTMSCALFWAHLCNSGCCLDRQTGAKVIRFYTAAMMSWEAEKMTGRRRGDEKRGSERARSFPAGGQTKTFFMESIWGQDTEREGRRDGASAKKNKKTSWLLKFPNFESWNIYSITDILPESLDDKSAYELNMSRFCRYSLTRCKSCHLIKSLVKKN